MSLVSQPKRALKEVQFLNSDSPHHIPQLNNYTDFHTKGRADLSLKTLSQYTDRTTMADVAKLENIAEAQVAPVTSVQGLSSSPVSDKSYSVSSEPPSRSVSPRRDNSAIDRIGREKVTVLRKEAQLMQDNLGIILGRLSQVKEDYNRLANENKFLQDYIGNLMSTSNILNKSAS